MQMPKSYNRVGNNISTLFIMKKMNFDEMATLQGGYRPEGWTWSIEQHVFCGMMGAAGGFGAGSAFVYLGCLTSFQLF